MKLLCFLEIESAYDEKQMSTLFDSISLTKREKLMKYRFDIDRKIHAYADILLRFLISKVSGMNPKDIAIQAGISGKPYIACTPHIEFNISHTRNAVAIALSDSPVGIDVERIRDIDLKLVEDIFTAKEISWLNAEKDGQYCRFYKLWTKKEAMAKYYGIGLPDNLKTVDVTDCKPTLSTLSFGDYIVTVCSDTEFGLTDVLRITEPELISMSRMSCVPDSYYYDGEVI